MISLGGGCYAKWAMIDAGIHQPSYFFDYMWNLDEGLYNVIQIMNDNFTGYLDRSKYEYVRTHKILNWDDFNVNHSCPGLALMHYDTREEHVFQSVCRKVERTRTLFESSSFKVFVYYRGYYKGDETVKFLQEESEAFVTAFSTRYNNNFVLVSFVEIPPSEAANGNSIIRNLINTSFICYDYVIQENKEHWKQQIQKYQTRFLTK